MKLHLLIFMFCLLLFAAPATALTEDNFTTVQFAGSGTSTYKDLLPVDLSTQDMNTALGAKDVSAMAAEKAAAIRLGEPDVVRPVTLDNQTDPTPTPTPTAIATPTTTVTSTPATTVTTSVPTTTATSTPIATVPTSVPTTTATSTPIATVPTSVPTTIVTTAPTSPQYLTGGSRLPYPQSGPTPGVYPGNTVFVYEQVKIKILDSPETYATSIAYMSEGTYPTPLNTIPADANGVINLLEVSVNGYTGAYRIYDNGVWTGSYIYVWMPELQLDAWYGGSTDSVNGQTVSKSSSINYVIDSPKVGPSGIGAVAGIVVTTPVGGKTSMLGYTDLSALSINSARIVTPPIPLGDSTLVGGIYQSQAEWTVPQSFVNYARKSNIISFSLGSTETLTITAAKDSVTRSNPFTVTVTGDPNTPYIISIDSTGSSAVPQMIAGQPGVTRGDANPAVQIGGVTKTVLIPGTAASDALSWAVVVTASDGSRIVQYSTNPVNGAPISEGTYTIRVNSITSYSQTTAGTGSNYDTAKIRISVGGLTIATTDGSSTYYMGQEIKLTGINTDSDTTYLFLTGANLNSNGVSLDGSGTFSDAAVQTDNTWTYTWDTGSSGLDVGTYTIYAVGSMSDKSQLAGAQYATISVQLTQPALSIGTTDITAAKGDYVHIAGTASGSPSGVAVFIFGTNYYQRVTTSVDNGRYDYKMYLPDSMSSGQYYVVVEHPMYDGKFGVVELTANGQTTLALLSANGGTQSSFVVEGPNRLQGSQAANALVRMLSSPYIDDIYTTLKLTVEEPSITINPIGNKEAGIPFVVSGTTNLAANDQILIEIVPASFVPGDKNQQFPSSGVSGTTTVAAGRPANSWSYPVSGSALSLDSYTIRVSGVSVTTSTSATFDVVNSPVVIPSTVPTTILPTTIPTTAPQPTPFGIGVLLSAIGIAALILRRQ